MFVSINHDNYQVMESWDGWNEHRTNQTSELSRFIEKRYEIEYDRVEQMVKKTETECQERLKLLERQYVTTENTIRLYHTRQFEAPDSFGSTKVEISSLIPCNAPDIWNGGAGVRNQACTNREVICNREVVRRRSLVTGPGAGQTTATYMLNTGGCELGALQVAGNTPPTTTQQQRATAYSTCVAASWQGTACAIGQTGKILFVETLCLHSDPPSADDALIALQEACTKNTQCVGYGWDKKRNVNWLYSVMPIPVLPTGVNSTRIRNSTGFCWGPTVKISFPSRTSDNVAKRRESALDSYKRQVAEYVNSTRQMLSNLKNMASNVKSRIYYNTSSANSPGTKFVGVWTFNAGCFSSAEGGCANAPPRGLTWNTPPGVVFNCPGCPKSLSAPTLDFFNRALLRFNLANATRRNMSLRWAQLQSNNTPTVKWPEDLDLWVDLGIKIKLPDLGLNLPLITIFALGFDGILSIYRIYRTISIMAEMFKGRDTEINLGYLRKEPSAIVCCGAESKTWYDRCLDCVIWVDHQIYYMNYKIWKAIPYIWAIVTLGLMMLFLYIIYQIIFQLIDTKKLSSLGVFKTFTMIPSVQRMVRNEALTKYCFAQNNRAWALSWFALRNKVKGLTDRRNAFNQAETQRVCRWNGGMCSAWRMFMENVFKRVPPPDVPSQYAPRIQLSQMTQPTATLMALSEGAMGKLKVDRENERFLFDNLKYTRQQASQTQSITMPSCNATTCPANINDMVGVAFQFNIAVRDTQAAKFKTARSPDRGFQVSSLTFHFKYDGTRSGIGTGSGRNYMSYAPHAGTDRGTNDRFMLVNGQRRFTALQPRVFIQMPICEKFAARPVNVNGAYLGAIMPTCSRSWNLRDNLCWTVPTALQPNIFGDRAGGSSPLPGGSGQYNWDLTSVVSSISARLNYRAQASECVKKIQAVKGAGNTFVLTKDSMGRIKCLYSPTMEQVVGTGMIARATAPRTYESHTHGPTSANPNAAAYPCRTAACIQSGRTRHELAHGAAVRARASYGSWCDYYSGGYKQVHMQGIGARDGNWQNAPDPATGVFDNRQSMNIFTIGNSTDYQGPYFFDCMKYKPICCERFQAEADRNRWIPADVGIDGGTLYPSNQAANIQRVTGISIRINAFRRKISAVRVFFTKAAGNVNPNIMLSEVDILAKLTADDQLGTCRMAAYMAMTNDNFNPNNVSGKCGVYRPVLTDPTRHFVKRNWDDAIQHGYDPFILAIQSICLSPFFIGLCGLGILMVVAVLRLLVEWFLMEKDLLRENVYTMVPLVQMRECAENNENDKYGLWLARAMAGWKKDRRKKDDVAVQRMKSMGEEEVKQYQKQNNLDTAGAGQRHRAKKPTKPSVASVTDGFLRNHDHHEEADGVPNSTITKPFEFKAKVIPNAPPRARSIPKAPTRKKPKVSNATFNMPVSAAKLPSSTYQQAGISTAKAKQASKWAVGKDKGTGKTYYFNRETQQSQWEKPPELGGDSSDESRSASDAPGMSKDRAERSIDSNEMHLV